MRRVLVIVEIFNILIGGNWRSEECDSGRLYTVIDIGTKRPKTTLIEPPRSHKLLNRILRATEDAGLIYGGVNSPNTLEPLKAVLRLSQLALYPNISCEGTSASTNTFLLPPGVKVLC